MRVEILYVIPVMHIVSMVRGQGGGLGTGKALLNF